MVGLFLLHEPLHVVLCGGYAPRKLRRLLFLEVMDLVELNLEQGNECALILIVPVVRSRAGLSGVTRVQKVKVSKLWFCTPQRAKRR